MQEYQFLTEFLLILVVSTIVAVSFERFKLSSILGFLMTGVIIGPNGLGLLKDSGRIGQMAELGVVLLMLTIGLEFSVARFKRFQKIALFGGTLQIILSVLIAMIFSLFRGWSLYEGFVLGAVIALSSTAIVLKYLIDRGELDTHYGRLSVSILIVQDLAVLPLMVFMNSFGGGGAPLASALGFAVMKTTILIGVVYVFSRFILPHLLQQVALIRNREIFFLTSVVICLGTACFSASLGLSLAIGAFFAGFMFANTEFGHQLFGEIIPFRYVFVSIFFVSIGLLFDPKFMLDHFVLITAVVGMVLLVNFVIMTFIIMLFGFPLRLAMATGLILSQIGEFSFLLIEAARQKGGIDAFLYQVLLSSAFLTMLITPFLFLLVPLILKISEKVALFGISPIRWKKDRDDSATALHKHVIICGFGPSGRDLALTFREENIPTMIVEMNPAKIKDARSQNFRVIYGDAANEEVMRRAGIGKARAVVVSFADTLGMAQIIQVVQRLNPKVLLAVRTRYEAEMPRLYDLGADIVVMEEWEASYELNKVILENFGISGGRIEHHLDRIRNRKELAVEHAIFKSGPKGKRG